MKSTALLRLLSLLLGALVCIGLLAASVTQEVPLGNLHGVITMKENGKALPNAWVTLRYLGGGPEDAKKYRHYETEKDGVFVWQKIPAGVYTIEVDAKAHEAKKRVVFIEEGKTASFDIALDAKDPELELYASQRVFTPGEKPSFEIRGFDPASKATVHYYKLDLGKIVKKGGLSTLLYSFSRPGNEGGSDPSKSATSADQFDKALTSKDVEGVFTEPIELPKLDEGFYYVTCQVGQNSKATYLNISTIGLVTKTTGADALCFVTDLVSGEPIKGAAVQLAGATGLKQVATTDSSGTAHVKVPSGELKKALLVSSFGKSQAVVDFDNETGESRSARIFIYSDRPIYRPGDKVQFKGIVRKLQGLQYNLPGAGSVAVEIRDSSETVIQKFSLPLTAKGTFSGSYTSNVEDEPGVYSIHAKYGGADFNYYVNLAAYRKPEFSIKVLPTKNYFIYGDKASATVKAEYYFGGPVVGAKVSAFVTRRQHYSYTDDYEDQAYDSNEGGDPSSGREFVGEYSEQVEAVTNEKGEATIEFDTKREGDPDVADYDLDYTVNASITDESNKYFDGTGDVTVVRGDFAANLELDHFVAEPGEQVNATVKVTRQDNGTPVVGRDVSIEFGDEIWKEDKSTFISKGTLTARTDSKGVAEIPIKAGSGGSMLLKLTVKDDAGRSITSQDYLWVEGDSLAGPPVAKFTLTLDKKRYRPGDACKVLIETDKPGGSALLTVQAEKVLSSYVVKLDKTSTMVTLPVTSDFAPNVWISAVAIKNRRLLEAESRLVVDTRDHDLKVLVTPDRPDYQPGETANLTIRTTDADGRPVPADLSIGVVDESIYAIKEDSTNIKGAFYPMREDNVRTNYSFEDIYLDGGDKAGGNIPVRSNFQDTAFWQPTVTTDSAGMARTALKLPDNLTSWRATAVGISATTQVGMAHVNFRARKPLSIRLEVPSFLVQQDTQRISAIVTNDTGQDQDVSVRLDAQGVTVAGALNQKIHVPASKPQAVSWEIQTPNSGEAKFTAYAWTDSGAKDAEGRSVDVQPHGRLIVQTYSGEIGPSGSASFNVSPTADKSSGRLLLTISPSVGATIYQSLDGLIGFPYGCTEQTMSRFLPTVLLASTLKQMGLNSDLEAKVPDMVSAGFARLGKMQHSNGAWGWWEYDDADMYMTAYVLDGLKRAKEAGYSSDKVDPSTAMEWVKKELKDAKLDQWNTRDFLYLTYAASEYGAKNEAKEAIKRVTPSGADSFALLALISHEIGDQAAEQENIAKLHELAKLEGNIARFESKRWEYGAESAAFPLVALTTLAPNDPLIPKLVRYLIEARKGDMWESTRDTSISLIGLTQYMKSVHDWGKPIDIDVTVNGGSARHVHYDPANQFSNTLRIVVPMAELHAGDNRVEFLRKGPEGLCFFGGELRQYDVAEKLLPLRDTVGLSIARNYYLLEPQRLENGSLELRPSRRSIDEARSGDLVRVELTISSNQPREFLMIEDPIPSGCRITEREYVDEGEEWGYWWTQTIVRDDKAAFFMRTLPQGMSKLSYTMRAEQIGLGHALPTTISNMYDPVQTASGGEALLKITE